jgi:hypothetical protein
MADETIVHRTERIYFGLTALSTEWDSYLLQVGFVDKKTGGGQAGAD